jgi:hypothetical protein
MASPMPLEPPVTVATLFNDMADSLELAQSTNSKASRPIQRASECMRPTWIDNETQPRRHERWQIEHDLAP